MLSLEDIEDKVSRFSYNVDDNDIKDPFSRSKLNFERSFRVPPSHFA